MFTVDSASTTGRKILSLPWVLIGLGLATEVIYLAATLRFPLLGLYAKPRLDYGKLVGYRVADLVAFPVVVLVLFGLFAAALWQVRQANSPGLFRGVLVFGALFQLTLMLMYPITAIDTFDHASYGRLLVKFGANPYVVAPGDPRYAGQVFAEYTGWPQWPSPYGPLWHYLTAPIAFIARANLLGNLIGLAVLVAGAAVVDGLLIHAILRRLEPDRAVVGALFWLWNPLVVFEAGGNRHNGTLMLAFTLLALWLLVSGRRFWVLPALMAGALVKWPVAVLIPLVAVELIRSSPNWRAAVRTVGGGGAVAGALFVGLCWPLLPGLKVFDLVTANLQFMTGSVGAIVVLLLQGNWSETVLSVTVRRTLAGVFAAYVLFRAFLLWRGRDELRRAAHDVMLCYLLVGSFWVMPWYASWVVVWGALTVDPKRFRVDVVFAASLMVGYAVGFFWHVVKTPPLLWQIQILAVNFGALLLLFLISGARTASHWLGPALRRSLSGGSTTRPV